MRELDRSLWLLVGANLCIGIGAGACLLADEIGVTVVAALGFSGLFAGIVLGYQATATATGAPRHLPSLLAIGGVGLIVVTAFAARFPTIWPAVEAGAAAILIVTLPMTVEVARALRAERALFVMFYMLSFGLLGLASVAVFLAAMFAAGTTTGTVVLGLAGLVITLSMQKWTFAVVTLDRSALARHFAIAHADAKTASEAKSAFLSSLSHELRTPLSSVLGLTELIDKRALGPQDLGKYESYIHHIHQSGRHLNDLVNDVMDLSLIEAGRFEIEEGSFQIGELVEDVTAMLAPSARARKIDLGVDPCEPDVTVRGDRRRIKQIVVNLLTNAIKYVDSGGHVRARTRAGRNGGLEVLIADDGPGLTAEQIERAFTRYGRVDGKRGSKTGGAGIGLPLARQLAEAHGGELRLESTPGMGCTAILGLPAVRVQAPRVASGAAGREMMPMAGVARSAEVRDRV